MLAAFRPQGRRKQKDGRMDIRPAHQATRRSRRWDKTENWLKGKWPTRRNPKLHASEGSCWQASLASIVPNLIHHSCHVVAGKLSCLPSTLPLRPAKGRWAEGRPHETPPLRHQEAKRWDPWSLLAGKTTSLPLRASLRGKWDREWTFKTPYATQPPLLQ